MKNLQKHREIFISSAFALLEETGSDGLFLFLNSVRDCRWLMKSRIERDKVVLVIPKSLALKDSELKAAGLNALRSWSGNQSRFSRIKYAFLNAVLNGIIRADSRIICMLGPWGSSHLDTLTIHDLGSSWSEEFPFDPRSLITNKAFHTVMAMVDIALDIGALGREGKSVGTTFVVGDSANVLESSHQAVFNPFRGYPKKERLITRPEVVESIKELAQLDGAVVVSEQGVVEAAGRHLDATIVVTKQLRGLGSRHRAAAGITRKTESVAVVVSESTGRITIFDHGRIVSTLEPVISRRLV